MARRAASGFALHGPIETVLLWSRGQIYTQSTINHGLDQLVNVGLSVDLSVDQLTSKGAFTVIWSMLLRLLMNVATMSN